MRIFTKLWLLWGFLIILLGIKNLIGFEPLGVLIGIFVFCILMLILDETTEKEKK